LSQSSTRDSTTLEERELRKEKEKKEQGEEGDDEMSGREKIFEVVEGE